MHSTSTQGLREGGIAIVVGDLNAKVRSVVSLLGCGMSRHGLGDCNYNNERVANFSIIIADKLSSKCANKRDVEMGIKGYDDVVT